MKKKILFVLVLTLSALVHAQQINVATYNIRYANDFDVQHGNPWTQRCPMVVGNIRMYDFDIFGTQEVLYSQLLDLKKALPEYGTLGVGREDGKTAGEYAAIFYRKDKLQLLQSGHFWLAEDPTQPKLGWDAACIRICTWGKFKIRKDGFTFWHFNLHADHMGKVAMVEGAKLVLRKIKEMCKPGDAVILTGDFNVDQHHITYQTIQNSGIVGDSYLKAKYRFAPNGTFNNFNPNNFTDSRIDHIFVTPAFTVERYGVLTNIYWTADKNQPAVIDKEDDYPKGVIRTPSDHYPVKVILSYKKK